MCTEIDSRISDRQSDEPVKPAAAPVKQSQKRGDDGVVYDVTRGERWPRAGAIRKIGKANNRLAEQRKKLRTNFSQLHHSHALHLFGPVTGHCGFQPAGDQPRDHQSDHQTDDERARFESPENERANSNRDKERLPNLGIAHPRHEQVERRTRPFFVD
jgi:hypothetical protein